MKIKMCIFDKIVSCIALGVILGGAYVATPALAVIDNTGCDNEGNLYINPDLALCSTHVYNMGKTENPTNSAERQIMQDVVALKTTLMTQQMYAQYEILATTVKRLRTQLQKEVLLAQLRATSATANGGVTNDGGDGGASYNSGDRNVVLAGAQNCAQKYMDASTDSYDADVLKCESSNLGLVLQVASSNRGDAKRQLEKDIVAISRIIPTRKVGATDKTLKEATGCTDISTQSKIENCVYSLRGAISDKLRELSRSNTQPRNTAGY